MLKKWQIWGKEVCVHCTILSIFFKFETVKIKLELKDCIISGASLNDSEKKTNTTEVMNKGKNSYIILLFQRLASESENTVLYNIYLIRIYHKN